MCDYHRQLSRRLQLLIILRQFMLLMAQFAFSSLSSSSHDGPLSAASDSHYSVHYTGPVVSSCAVQFPTPVSRNSLPPLSALVPNIDAPQWQHAAVAVPSLAASSSGLHSCVTVSSDASSSVLYNSPRGHINMAALASDVNFQQPTSLTVQQ